MLLTGKDSYGIHELFISSKKQECNKQEQLIVQDQSKITGLMENLKPRKKKKGLERTVSAVVKSLSYSVRVSVKKRRVIKTLFCLVHGNPLKAVLSDIPLHILEKSFEEKCESKIPHTMESKMFPYDEEATQMIILENNEERGILLLKSQPNYPDTPLAQQYPDTPLEQQVPTCEDIAPYKWTGHIEKVLKYFEDNLDLSTRTINGGTDLVLVESSYIKSKMLELGIHATIELKKKLKDGDYRQAILQMIVADTSDVHLEDWKHPWKHFRKGWKHNSLINTLDWKLPTKFYTIGSKNAHHWPIPLQIKT
ncbi:907_t:CDS:2 [Funneliformis mosseae]|uniref:907_t:CDS:1 n=1 Tax=Funneliformis mosseae TaxID=27381 RepID=A0A9N9A253_FUNMO|nr:907_t:CDS:2 [Funneliformis mosseae]